MIEIIDPYEGTGGLFASDVFEADHPCFLRLLGPNGQPLRAPPARRIGFDLTPRNKKRIEADMTIANTTPMAICLTESPWQQIPEMEVSYHAERAGIEAGLRLLEVFHNHYALRLKAQGKNQACTLRLTAAVCAAQLRADIVGLMA